MRLLLVCKRHYTNRDLLLDRYGRLFHLPTHMASLGHQVRVVAADYQQSDACSFEYENVVFESVPSSISRLPYFGYRAWSIARDFDPDIVIASGDTHLGVLGRSIARMRHVPFVFDMYDDYRAFASARIPGMHRAFQHLLRNSDLIVCAGERLQDIAEVYTQSTLVIHNGVDRSIFAPMDKQTIRTSIGFPLQAPIVGYFGSITERRGLDVLIRAIDDLRARGQMVHLLIAGSKDIPLDLSQNWIHYAGLVPQEELAKLINASDVAVIPYLRSPQIDVSNASKLPEYLACGIPIVTTRVSNYAELFGIHPEAVCVPGDEADLARALAFQLEHGVVALLPPEFEWQQLAIRLEASLIGLVTELKCDNSPTEPNE